MKLKKSSVCCHKFCQGCVGLTWTVCIPPSGPNLVCCNCQTSKNIREASEKFFVAQPRDEKRFWYQPEFNFEGGDEDGEQ
jgi:hypothetical protein